MKKLGSIFVLGYFFVFLLSSMVLAEDINNIIDDFYNGLAEIIERNMEDPERGVKEVEDYYQNNQEAVNKIRQQAEKAMEQIAPQIDKYMSMAEEEAAALAEQQKARENTAQGQMSRAAQRYTEALKAFTTKYPKYAMEIAGQAMQLFPGFDKKQKDINYSSGNFNTE
jgi:leucyl aminopeptidase (aminopeptidase T)